MVKEFTRIDPTHVVDAGYRKIVIKTFEVPGMPDTHEYTTWWAEGGRSAGVIALTKDKQVIVASQFRPGPERIMKEIPGGGIEEGEETQAAALRELAEETGYRAGSIEYLGESSRDAYANAKNFYYLALDCELTPGGQNLDDGEILDVELISIDELINNAKNDMMTDPVAVLMAYDRLLEFKETTHA